MAVLLSRCRQSQLFQKILFCWTDIRFLYQMPYLNEHSTINDLWPSSTFHLMVSIFSDLRCFWTGVYLFYTFANDFWWAKCYQLEDWALDWTLPQGGIMSTTREKGAVNCSQREYGSIWRRRIREVVWESEVVSGGDMRKQELGHKRWNREFHWL